MTSKLQFGLAATIVFGFSLAASSFVEAQRMAPASAPRAVTVQPRPVHTVRPVSRRNGGLAGASFRATSNGFAPASSSSLTLQQLLDPVPPPGFDYAYLAAMDSELAVKAFIDPVTQLRFAAAERVLRDTGGFAGSSFYLLGSGGGYDLPAESGQTEQPPQQQSQQPQIIVLQQAPPAQQTAQPASEAAPESAPLPDVGQFILVLRNGTKVQAVAFTRSNDKIVYITVDGSRRTIALADLDSAATVHVNQEQGTPLQLPM
jgi:hypothetical protein